MSIVKGRKCSGTPSPFVLPECEALAALAALPFVLSDCEAVAAIKRR
jgi:hypothetical protein